MRRYDLVNPLSMFHEFDKNFSQFFGDDSKNYKRELNPVTKVKEEDNFYHLMLDVPGVKKENLDVELKGNVLQIRGERRNSLKNKDGEFESLGSFEKSFTLPEISNFAEIEVSHDHGVLDIIIPKTVKTNESKKLEIKNSLSLS